MARVLGILGCGRKDGYTIRVLKAVLEGASSVEGVDTELIHLLNYEFGSCTSCYECIRSAEHRCVLRDDMGGDGRLWKKVEDANGMVLASPVHMWSADALTHLFMERLYPFVWSGRLIGMPVVTLAVASNQGMHIVANRMLCQWAFTLGMRYIGGLPVHVAYMDEALKEARYLGVKLGREALKDELEGRRKMTDEERWLYYHDKPWDVFAHYVENLTMGTGDVRHSIIRKSLAKDVFRNTEALKLLEKADELFEEFYLHYRLGEFRKAIRALVKASAYWTHATWKEFLEDKLIRVRPPKAYRPVAE
ncbi:hypothetical protein CW710_00755 [Candidatus Bathyarchaeota archaeon]|nr:MAG: hypothetical protein CW710_00755 [Candidatus Bathyarchaeota archaeon]